MKRFIRFAAIGAILAAAFAACEDGVSVPDDAAGNAAGIYDMGLPGGIDPVDAFGNVIVSRNITLTQGVYFLHNYFAFRAVIRLPFSRVFLLRAYGKEQVRTTWPRVPW